MRTLRSALIAAAVLSVSLSTLGGSTYADASEWPSGDEIVAKLNVAYPLWKKAQARVMNEIGMDRFADMESFAGDAVALARTL